ncbi:MAG: hypothetical protein C0617_03230 [Desulfuromonas sp.]|uniref:efflux RND transporter periplasmic adaptor subunit n=1 Tax=Desulfuromonas sp. TaxID=892 RepID=UPI000CC2CAA4|nr:efflux RND transporter periplasmic adaptor subunit [Desulfuromonas sp.]PLX85707.1 MAG: hypothetical protein C0617_03230 [Desulfuromonas sp.]
MNRTMTRALVLGCLALAALSGCGKDAESGTNGEGTPREKVTNVTLATVTAADHRENFTLPGTLEAWEDLTLAAEIPGSVRWIGPEEGDRLKQGQSILRLDLDTLEAKVARDQAEYDRLKQHLQRRQGLVEKKLVSQQEYEDAVQALKVAEANLRVSRVALEKSSLRSPVDGVLDELLIDLGEYVGVGDPVAVVVQVDRLKVLVDVPEKDVADLAVGDGVEVEAASIGRGAPPRLSGKVIHLAYKADPVTRTYRAKIAIDNSAGSLRPGMIVKAAFVRRELKGVIAVPLYALVDQDGVKVVYVAEEGRAVRRVVVAGPVVGDRVVIVEGLASGEKLIVKGQQLVTDGAAVSEGH